MLSGWGPVTVSPSFICFPSLADTAISARTAIVMASNTARAESPVFHSLLRNGFSIVLFSLDRGAAKLDRHARKEPASGRAINAPGALRLNTILAFAAASGAARSRTGTGTAGRQP